jgi:hypothetical protein
VAPYEKSTAQNECRHKQERGIVLHDLQIFFRDSPQDARNMRNIPAFKSIVISWREARGAVKNGGGKTFLCFILHAV